MKIALMTNNFKPFIGGVPISIERLANSLLELGHQVTVFAPYYQGYCDREKFKVVRYSTCLQKFIGGIVLPNPFDPMIEKEFRKGDFDIIHVHHPMLIGRTAVYLSKKYNVPLVYTYHTRYEQYVTSYSNGFIKADGLVQKYLHTFMKHCNHILAPTDGMKSILVNAGYHPEKISVLPTGIYLKECYDSEVQRIREYYCGSHQLNIPMFLSVSRMANEKNVPFLIYAAAKFKERYQKPFRLLLIGDGPDRTSYQALCRGLSLEKEVVFMGKVANEQIAAYYHTADAFLFASKTETQGIVILEAFAGASPVIAVDATGVRDLVEDRENGYLCPENVNVFTNRMLEVISQDDLKKQLSHNAFLTAQKYLQEAVAQKALGIYNKVIVNAYQKSWHKEKHRRVRVQNWNGNITY